MARRALSSSMSQPTSIRVSSLVSAPVSSGGVFGTNCQRHKEKSGRDVVGIARWPMSRRYSFAHRRLLCTSGSGGKPSRTAHARPAGDVGQADTWREAVVGDHWMGRALDWSSIRSFHRHLSTALGCGCAAVESGPQRLGAEMSADEHPFAST